MSKNLQKIGKTLNKTVTAPLIGVFTMATKGMDGFRRQMAILDTNAQLAGVSLDVINQQMRLLQGITGQTDSNVEALSNLLAAGFKDDSIVDLIDQLAGAVIRWPDTLKIEGLADGLQETLATGQAIGPFAELLERLGFNIDDFNVSLRRATESGKQHQFIIDLLANKGLADYTEAFKENNPELMKSAAATYDFKTALKELGDTLTPIVTQITQYTTRLIELYNNLNPEQQKFVVNLGLIAAAAGPTLSFFGKMTGSLAKLKVTTIALTGKIALVVAAVAGLIAIVKYAYETNEDFRETVDNLFSDLKENFGIIKKLFQEFWDDYGEIVIDFLNYIVLIIAEDIARALKLVTGLLDLVVALITGDVNKAIEGTSKIINSLLTPINQILRLFGDWEITAEQINKWLQNLPSDLTKLKTKIRDTFSDLPKLLINPVISMLNTLIDGLNRISFEVPNWVPGVGGKSFGINIPRIPALAEGGIVTRPTLALIGEGGESEAVIPLSRLGEIGGKQPINIYIGNRLLGRYMVDEFGRELSLQSGLRV